MKSTAFGMGVFDAGAFIGLGATADAVGMGGAGEDGNTRVLGGAPSSTGRGEAEVPRPTTGDGERTDDDPNTEVEEEEDCSIEGDGAAGFRFC